MKRLARYAVFYGALLGLWILLAELKIWPPYLFPTPKGVLEALYAGFSDHSFWIAIGVSTKTISFHVVAPSMRAASRMSFGISLK